jgi:hypothetical protein
MIRSIEKIHLIGTRTRDLPACSIVPQPTTLSRPPTSRLYANRYKVEDFLRVGFEALPSSFERGIIMHINLKPLENHRKTGKKYFSKATRPPACVSNAGLWNRLVKTKPCRTEMERFY